jgi:hypothetical protein
MIYPELILPNPACKIIDGDLSEYFLIRYVDNVSGTLPEPILEEHICTPRDKIEDLSTSLLGIFVTEYIHLTFTKESFPIFMQYCAPDYSASIPVFEKDFYSKKDRTCWYIQIGQIHGKDFPYKSGENDLVAVCNVIHTPMIWNYWHFSVRWSVDGIFLNDMDTKQKEKIARKIGFAARVLFSKFAVTREPEFTVMENYRYYK